ncbi:TBC1 domain family member 30 isoform X1 [Electrophorus electricus]|uniref:TBC1 domain family member 30 isoform X1 n=1 Tax=Electrophorus electricus TaxID=8005 RepID=UPI0015D0A65E|nr:TBC1 domain family member 30 isoform X1 [Electrophorus electricus]XP_035384513.1 TBC1 domain family member 30 isoform X1 [Electrophorus electricus]
MHPELQFLVSLKKYIVVTYVLANDYARAGNAKRVKQFSGHFAKMSSVEVSELDLKEVDICDGDICSEEESGVFVNSGASFIEGFSALHKWVSKNNAITATVPDVGLQCAYGAPTLNTVSSKCSQRSNGAANAAGVEPGSRGRSERSDDDETRATCRASIVDRLLVELYDTYASTNRVSADSLDSSTETSSSDAFLGRSNTVSNFLQELQEKHTRRHQMKYLAQKDPEELKWIIQEVKYRIGIQSAKLVRQVKRKDRLHHKQQKKCDIVTACLQAVSQKRSVDTRLKFTLEPSLGKNGFQQWYDALKAVARLPTGIPKEWRRKVWLTLADQYLHSISIDWEKTMRFTFNDRSNPDDDSLGIQIVKDLHRTGCSSYCGQEAEQDRVVLKRVLLAYARWNKAVGYCQGFNVLAALILEVTEGNEGDALKVMIYLIDKVLPDSYFANNLRALSVDMAAFRDLLRLKLPELSQHLHHLQKVANRAGGGSYEPPLTNVFTMQWFLTMFATCLPHHTVLKIWDSVFFEGSEVLLRVALAIWAKLGERIEECQTADEFYSTMGCLTQEMLEHNLIDSNELMQTVYSMAVFPLPQLTELREKYTYNITPFPAPVKANGSSQGLYGWESDDDGDMDDEDSVITALGCLGPLGGLLAPEIQRYQKHLKEQRGEPPSPSSNMAELSPGAVGAGRAEHQAAINSMMLERMSTDIRALTKQYSRIKRRQQQQAGLLYIRTDKCPATSVLTSQVHSSPVVNHLLLGRKPQPAQRASRNGILYGPRGHAGPLPQSQSTPSLEQGARARLQSPWRAHVRAHRRNLARARAQLGFDDSLSPEDDDSSEPKLPLAGDEKTQEDVKEQHVEQEEGEREKTDESAQVIVEVRDSDFPLQDSGCEEEGEIKETEERLSTLELESSEQAPSSASSEPGSTSPIPQSEPQPSPPALMVPCCTHRTDSSSSESRAGSLGRSPVVDSALELAPKAQQIFSPFPCMKAPRKSLAARNLGLYGPTSRTPTVHFPHMSKTVNRLGAGTSAATRRR